MELSKLVLRRMELSRIGHRMMDRRMMDHRMMLGESMNHIQRVLQMENIQPEMDRKVSFFYK